MSNDYDPDNPMKGASKCPHCGGLGIVVQNDELRAVCGLCGAPRIKVQVEGITLSGGEVEPLTLAEKMRKARFLWRTAGVFGGAASGFGVLVSALLALVLSWGWGVAGLIMTLPFILLTIAGFTNASAKTAKLRTYVDAAWRSAARDVASQHRGGVTTRTLQESLGLSEAGAEQVLAELAVDDMMRSDVTSAGQLRVEPVASLRVDAGATGASKTLAIEDDLEARFEALEEAMAAEEASQRQVKR